jgi:hypothetical protein
LKPGTAREAVSQHFGSPEGAVPTWVEDKAKREANASETWTVWKIRGRPARVDDGGGQATVSALTLGIGEAILLPMTLIEEGGGALKTYFLIGIFDSSGRLRRYHALEANEKKS